MLGLALQNGRLDHGEKRRLTTTESQQTTTETKGIMSAVIKHDPQSVGLAEVMQLGDVFKASGFFKDLTDQAKAVVKILYGRELGFSPVSSIMGIYIIEGKPSLSANLMAAMVKRSGRYDYRVKELTNDGCILTFMEKGEPIGESSFNKADAKAAGLEGKFNWKAYPRNMMFARALSNGVRMYCPDLSAAPIYVPEELGAEVNEEGDVTSHPVEKPKLAEAPRTFGVVKEVAPKVVEVSPELAKFNEERSPVDTPALVKTLAEQRNETAVLKPALATEYIDGGQQTNFAIEFKKALPKSCIGRAEEFRHQWLAANGYVDKDGNPSSKVIPNTDFLIIRETACDWAKGCKP